jgi:hypothetical protein
MLCRTLVEDYDKWKAVFDSHAAAHREAGLVLLNLWRSIEDSNNVYFLFEVSDIDRANEFLHSPASAEAGEASGVLEGEYHFLESGD